MAKEYASITIVSTTARLVQYASAPAATFFWLTPECPAREGGWREGVSTTQNSVGSPQSARREVSPGGRAHERAFRMSVRGEPAEIKVRAAPSTRLSATRHRSVRAREGRI